MKAYYNEIDPYCCQWLRNLIAAGHIPAGYVDERPIQEVKSTDLVGYTACHFFAGIGGWPYALRLAGWPDDREVWTGSCPCQPFSAAGKRRGVADERHLWPEFARLIGECRPAVTFGEQVASKDGRLWLAGVRTDLEALGYAVGAADISAASIGAPHIRQRLWWVAQSDGRQSGDGNLQRSVEYGQQPEDGGTVRVADAMHTGRPERWTGTGDGQTAGSGDASRLADSRGARLAQRGSDGSVQREEVGAFEGEAVICGSGVHRAWDTCDLIPCLDGKARRVESGTFPLVTRLSPSMGSDRPGEDSPYRSTKLIGQAPWRIGMLRAYGNAIVPQVAAEFVKAYIKA